MYHRAITWTWTNWTFGVWFYKSRNKKRFGIDIGPFEVTWRQR